MKTTITTLLTTICVSSLLLSAAAQLAGQSDNNVATTPNQSTPPAGADAPAQDQGAMSGQAATSAPTEIALAENQPITSTVITPRGNAPEAVASAFAPPSQAIGTNQNDLNLNFVNAPLDMVLNYLSDATGFIVVQDTRVNGTVTIVGKHLTQDETVNLLNSELNRNNYAAIRDGRTLTIMNKNDAKTRNIPVKIGNNPDAIPNNDEIATWIIPIRFVEARQLVSDFSLFVSPQATIVANEAGNSIVVTDTQSNIRHLAEIIKAVDDSAEAETEIRVFPLKYASPTDVANELSSVFPSGNSSGSQAPMTFGGGPPDSPGGGPSSSFGNVGTTTSSSQQRIQKATQVTVVADSRIQAVIVTAPNDLMPQIEATVTSLDVPSNRDQIVSTIQLQNGDPQQVAQVLQSIFSSGNTSSTGTSSQNSALMQRQQSTTTSMGTTTTSAGISGNGTGAGGGGNGGNTGSGGGRAAF